jgi:hypothetical protein
MEQRHQPWPQLNQGLEQENIAGNLHRYLSASKIKPI